MKPNYYQLGVDLWLAIGLLWVAGMLGGKRNLTTQSPGSRALQMGLSILAFLLVFSRQFGAGWLGFRILPGSSVVQIAGLAITFAALCFAAWARLQLGGNWSAIAAVKQDHALVRSGPYSIVRHPIYTGFIFGLLGMGVIQGEVRGWIGAGVLFVAFLLKSRSEEAFMVQTFNGQYEEYRRHVKALIPFIF